MRSDTARRPIRWSTVALFAFLCVASVPFLFPTWWMVTSSVKSNSEIFRTPPTLWPQEVTFEPYVDAFTLQPFAQQYLNSLYIAVVVTVGTIVVSALAGYAFARIRFPGANALFVFLLAGIIVPPEVTIVPLFRLFNGLGLINTHWPLILVPILGAPSVLGTFIMRQFFLGIPPELEEAGRLDGLSRFGLFWRIAFPLVRPAIAAVAILTFLRTWNSFLEPLVFLSSREMFTLPLALTQFQDTSGEVLWNTQLAATTLTVVPVLLVFLFAQRQFVQSLAQTGIK